MDPWMVQTHLSRAVMSLHHEHLRIGSIIGLVFGMVFIPLFLLGLCIAGKVWWDVRRDRS